MNTDEEAHNVKNYTLTFAGCPSAPAMITPSSPLRHGERRGGRKYERGSVALLALLLM
jgi:hypothetical protein